jgi:hypothetical protein
MTANSGRRGHHAKRFYQTDFSIYLLGLPKSRLLFFNWLLLAVLTGTILGLSMRAIGDLIF